MKALILAAGYATRLYPLTKDFPKPLLSIGGITILDRIIDDLSIDKRVDEFIVVTNHRFEPFFSSFAKERKEKITVIDDGTLDNENRLGAVKDIALAIEKCRIDDDLYVLAGDNIIDFSLSDLIRFFELNKVSSLFYYEEQNVESLRHRGVVVIGEGGKVLSFTEKPDQPKSRFTAPPFYILEKTILPLVNEALASGCGKDAPGHFLQWASSRIPMAATPMSGSRVDVGSLEQYGKLCTPLDAKLNEQRKNKTRSID